MPIFVHIADERDVASIRRAGLRLARAATGPAPDRPTGVFALPVVADFAVTHQWLRELKKRGFRVATGVYFRLTDDEPVWAGRYDEQKRRTTAAQAAGTLARDRTLGYEVLVPRSIGPAEIHAVRALPQSVGWRHFPDAHRQGVYCGCRYCQRGEIKSRRLRDRYEARER
ncbi:MAG: hypothetical protein U1F51_00495 [Burkholderiales bacterium]